MICDADGNELPAGEMGEVWMRSARATRRPTATSAPRPARRDGGWESLGDMGWLDEDGYLYLGDRMQDMILSRRREHLPGRGRGRAPRAPGRAVVRA